VITDATIDPTSELQCHNQSSRRSAGKSFGGVNVEVSDARDRWVGGVLNGMDRRIWCKAYVLRLGGLTTSSIHCQRRQTTGILWWASSLRYLLP